MSLSTLRFGNSLPYHVTNQGTVRFTKKDVGAYLDTSITAWRSKRDQAPADSFEQTQATHYVDAFQSVRASLLGAPLPAGR